MEILRKQIHKRIAERLFKYAQKSRCFGFFQGKIWNFFIFPKNLEISYLKVFCKSKLKKYIQKAKNDKLVEGYKKLLPVYSGHIINIRIRVDSMIEFIIKAIWLMLPAYLPNPFAALLGGGKAIDGGRTLADGQRLLGDGKTWRGLFAGVFFGLLAGCIQIWLSGRGFEILGLQMPAFGPDFRSAFRVVFALASGALFGDMFMSFFKRRLGFKRGAPLPVVDQLDFVLGAWGFTYLVAPAWFMENFSFWILLSVIIITPLLHVATNVIAYLIGVKKEPW